MFTLRTDSYLLVLVTDPHAEPAARARGALQECDGRPAADRADRGRLAAHQRCECAGGGGGACPRSLFCLLREDQVLVE